MTDLKKEINYKKTMNLEIDSDFQIQDSYS